MKKIAILLALLMVVTSVMVAGCGRVYTAPNPVPLARAVPHDLDARFDNCNVCHNGDQLNAIIPHTDYTNNDCTQAGCHATSMPATTTPAQTTPAQTTPAETSSGPTSPGETTPSGAPTLTIAALALTGANHSAGTATMCLLCHGPGVGAQQFPIAPTWDGTNLTPGPWSVTAGSDQDHTGRTDAATCVQSGCHAQNW